MVVQKVVILESDMSEKLEDGINLWISQHEADPVEITDIHYAVACTTNKYVVERIFTALILYRENI